MITTPISDALMTTNSTTKLNVCDMDDTSCFSKTTLSECARPNTIFLPVVNPVLGSALVEDDRTTTTTTIEQQSNTCPTPSPLDTPTSNVGLHNTSTKCCTSVDPSHSMNSKAILNVGGVKHEVMWRTLARFPSTRLGRLAVLRKSAIASSRLMSHDELIDLCDDYNLSSEEFFFDRHPRSFTSIINYYRTGKLHLIDDICVISFHDDLVYWEIDEFYFELCCQNKYHEKKEHILEEMKKEIELLKEEPEEKFDGHCCRNIRQKIWDLFEHPHTSKAARIITFVSMAFILLSSFTLTIGTIEDIGCTQNITATEITINHTSTVDSNAVLIAAKSATEHDETYRECHERLFVFIIEAVCVSWFTIEYIIRLYATPNKWTFFKNVLNTIDLISILPFYVSIILETLYRDNIKDLKSVRKVTEVLRVLRIIRIFKLARHSTGLQILGYSLRRSYKELSMLLMFLGIFILLFSSSVYFAEKDKNAEFRSIPHAFWWAIITMTTVGYGDMYPKSIWGKLIGSVCSLCGVLVIALPIPIIVNNFTEYYKEQLKREKALKNKEAVDLANKNKSIIPIESQFISNSNLSLNHGNTLSTSPMKDMSNFVHTSDEPLYHSTCYENKILSSPSKQMSHAIHLFSTNNQNIKQQDEDEDAKETLLTKKYVHPIDDEQRNSVLKS